MISRLKSGVILDPKPFLLALITSMALILAGCGKSPEQLLEQARQQVAANDYPAASISLKNLLQAESDSLDGRLLLAEVSLALNDPLSAEKELARARDLGAEGRDHMELYLETLLTLNRFAEVLDVLSHDSVETGLTNTESLIARGRALLGLGNSLEAEAAFNEALILEPGAEMAMWGLASAHAERGEKDEAIEMLDLLIESHPKSARGWLLRGQVALREGRVEDAHREFSTGLQSLEGTTNRFLESRIIGGVIDSKLYLDDTAGAETLLDRLRVVARGEPMTAFLAAKTSAKKGDYELAANRLEGLLEMAPANVSVLMLYGSVNLGKQDFAQAEAVFRQVVSRYPDNLVARRLLAAAQSKLGDPSAVIETLGPILEQGVSGDAGLSVMASRAFTAAGSAEQAVALLEEALADAPENREIMLNLASAYLAVGRPNDAIDLAQTIPVSDVDYQRELILALGYAAVNQGSSADQQIATITERNPDDLAVLVLAGDFYLNTNNPTQALEYFTRGVAIDDSHIPSRLGIARAHYALGDRIAAAANYEAVLESDSSNVQALTELANLWAIASDIARSIELLEQAVELNTGSPIPHIMLARALIREGDMIRAERLAREASRLAPEGGLVQAEVGGILLEAGLHTDALSFLSKAVELAPNSSESWYLLGRSQIALGESADARMSLNRAIELNPSSVVANLLMAMLEMREGDLQSALEIALLIKESNPGNPAPLAVEADVLMEMERFSEAEDIYNEVYDILPSGRVAMRAYQAGARSESEDRAETLKLWVADNPSDWGAANMLGMHYDEIGEYDDAINAYEKAVASNEGNFVGMNNLAVRYSEKGDDRAQALAERAYAIRPNAPIIADTLGWIMVRNGDPAGGLPILEEAAANAPGVGNIQYHLAYARNELGDAEGSLEVLQRIIGSGIDFSESENAIQLLNEIESGE
jgi:putative PEP-CTERM system TPR-repeat lipoprotein